MTAQETARTAAEAVRTLNHQTRPGAAALDVTNLYDLLGELALMASRLSQLLHQLENLLDQLVEHHQVAIVDGPNVGDRPRSPRSPATGSPPVPGQHTNSRTASTRPTRSSSTPPPPTLSPTRPAIARPLPSRSSCPGSSG